MTIKPLWCFLKLTKKKHLKLEKRPISLKITSETYTACLTSRSPFWLKTKQIVHNHYQRISIHYQQPVNLHCFFDIKIPLCAKSKNNGTKPLSKHTKHYNLTRNIELTLVRCFLPWPCAIVSWLYFDFFFGSSLFCSLRFRTLVLLRRGGVELTYHQKPKNSTVF